MSAPVKRLKVLVVDDDEQIRRALRSILTTKGYEVVLASEGRQAIDLAIDQAPDLVILDLSMPGMDGLQVCRELRTWLTVPILVLSVHTTDVDKIAALDTGADDYLTKPFSAGELLARLRALVRRATAAISPPPTIAVGDMEVDIARRRVFRSGVEIALTRTEFDILAYLARNADCVVTSKMLLEHVWGPEYVEDTQTLRTHISHLRRKVEPDPSVPRYILTEPGVGYRLSTG